MEKKQQEKQDKTKGIITLIIAIIGILVLFKVRAILGGIIYLVAFGFGLYMLKSKVDYSATFSISYFIKNIRKENFWTEGIYTIIVVLLPLIVCITIYRWIVVDTVRDVNNLYNNL